MEASKVAQVVAKHQPVPMSFIALKNTYAKSGKPEELLKKYGLTAEDIEGTVLSTITRKHL